MFRAAVLFVIDLFVITNTDKSNHLFFVYFSVFNKVTQNEQAF